MIRSPSTWALVVILLVASPLAAQTMGRIQGTVTDATGAPVAGVAVVATSPSLQGVQALTTDARGEFRFVSMPPGTYAIELELSGFKRIHQTGVLIGLDRTVTLAFRLEVAGVVETVNVTGASPAIDRTSTTTGVNVTADLFTRVPVRRDIYSIARVAAGTQDDGIGPVVYGSSGAENNYIIDGLNTTGIELGEQGKQLNFDFVEEIEMKTGGFPAEYGRMTGGIINVVTKSGGNTFRGDLFGFYEGGGLQSDEVTANLRPQATTTVTEIDDRWDFGGDLGGYLVRDRLWFFGAYNRMNRTDNFSVIRTLVSPGSPGVGSVIPRDTRRDLFAAKLTWKVSPSQTITGSVFGDPGEIVGPVFPIAGPSVTWDGLNRTGGTDFVTRYDGVFGRSVLVRGLYGRHQETTTIEGTGKGFARLIDRTVTPAAASNGFGLHEDQAFSRHVFKVDLTRFWGPHEVKLGADYELTTSNNASWFGGAGQSIAKLRQASTGVIYYRHTYYVNDLAPGYNRSDATSWQIAAPLTSTPRSKSYAAFVQDSWKLASRFTLNLGMRYELQDLQNRFGESALMLDANWAPRIGFAWDVMKTGRSKVYASYGRFFENVPQHINIRAFGGEVVCFCNNFSASPADTRPDPSAPVRSSISGGSASIDPELKGQHVDEILGGFEYEVAPNLVLGTKVTYRTVGRAIEDLLVDPVAGEFAIANPGEGTLGTTVFFYDQVGSAPAPDAERRNYSFELTGRKRFSNGWQFLTSYVWTRLEGNYDGVFQKLTGRLSPNLNSVFDHADFLINAKGPLSAERTHQFKFDGSYELSRAVNGLNLGLSAWYYSGLPLNALGYSFEYVNWEYFLVPRGSLGRGPGDWEADIHVGYPIKLGERSRLTILADVFNAFNRQAITQYDEHYNLPSDGDACAGIPIGICGAGGGIRYLPDSIEPAGSIPDPRASATNPDYLRKGVTFTLPRSIRIGVRVTF